MLLHTVYAFETDLSSEDVLMRISEERFSTSGAYGIPYIPAQKEHTNEVVLRAAADWKTANTPRVEMTVTPTESGGRTQVLLHSKPGLAHRRFFAVYAVFAALLTLAMLVISITGHAPECLIGAAAGAVLLLWGYGVMRYFTKRYSNELFQQIESLLAPKGRDRYNKGKSDSGGQKHEKEKEDAGRAGACEGGA